ncbi:universal stress protein [Acinetobacter tianfuensis]|uniref:Universal stress protein n=1 Tax=Acinetobacter tianfuensis TaxID=2419603 RepID=A0A3A8EA01_9GAMM|nr:universal stress protein [Acinetobacter tianfuensis]RKG30948.1 universal stress protein [Acinetobacter tianfuensis]
MSYHHILVPVDGSNTSIDAVKKAAQIAKAFNSQLTLISLVVEDPFTDSDFYASSVIMHEYFVLAKKNAQEALLDAQKAAAEAGVQAQVEIIKGNVDAKVIAETAVNHKADLIVMGSHGRKGIQKMLLGSFAQDVLANTQLPVLIVKAKEA